MISGVLCIAKDKVGCIIFGQLLDVDLICIGLRMVIRDEYEFSLMFKCQVVIGLSCKCKPTN